MIRTKVVFCEHARCLQARLAARLQNIVRARKRHPFDACDKNNHFNVYLLPRVLFCGIPMHVNIAELIT